MTAALNPVAPRPVVLPPILPRPDTPRSSYLLRRLSHLRTSTTYDAAMETDTISKALGVAQPLVDSTFGLIAGLLGEPCRIAGEMLADEVYHWQCRNRIRVLLKVKQRLELTGVPPRVVPRGFLLPILQASGNVEDDELQELFANLLVAGVSSDDSQHPAFVQVIRQISVNEARLLRLLRRERGEAIVWFDEANLAPAEYMVASGLQEALVENDVTLWDASHLATLGLLEPKRRTITACSYGLTLFGISMLTIVMPETA